MPHAAVNLRVIQFQPWYETCIRKRFMVRRFLLVLLALSLAAIIPIPLSACAILSPLRGPCQCPLTMQCGPGFRENAGNEGPAISCRGIVSESATPQNFEKTGQPAPEFVAVSAVSIPRVNLNRGVQRAVPEIERLKLSPTANQARICIFLI